MIKRMGRKVKRIMRNNARLRKLLRDDVSRITPTHALKLPGGRLTFRQDLDTGLFNVFDRITDQTVYVSDRSHLELYREGTTYRQSWLLRDYCLPMDLIEAGDCVIDIGANIGELGLWVEAAGGRYMAFEPDPKAFAALRKNVQSDQLHDVALSDEVGIAEFYLSTEQTDSSLFQPTGFTEKIAVQKTRLDDFMANIQGWDHIKLVKIEAEGMEPEVIRGALETLKRAEYIGIDAGPERGGENTVPTVLNTWMPLGFEVVSCFLKRGTFFLRKKA